jgi:hypothetical protein
VIVEGLPLSYTGRAAEYYYTYGLALAKLGYCNQALPISQALQLTVTSDTVSQANAQEIITQCAQLATLGAPTPTAFTTPTITPSPTSELTQTAMPIATR